MYYTCRLDSWVKDQSNLRFVLNIAGFIWEEIMGQNSKVVLSWQKEVHWTSSTTHRSTVHILKLLLLPDCRQNLKERHKLPKVCLSAPNFVSSIWLVESCTWIWTGAAVELCLHKQFREYAYPMLCDIWWSNLISG